MAEEKDHQPISTFAAVREVVKDEFGHLTEELAVWKDEILTSNDKVVRKLDRVLTEQKAITVNYTTSLCPKMRLSC